MVPRAKSSVPEVLLVDQAGVLEELLAPLFALGKLSPCGRGCDFASCLAAVRDRAPALILIDFPAASPEALAAIEAVMAEKPTPILVLYRQGAPTEDVFRALDRGALDMVEWPDAPPPTFWPELARRICLLAGVRVVQHVKGKSRKRNPGAGPGRPPFPLVAIASSLGGPKALSLLLSMLPKSFPAPVLICQHISTGFTEGLARWLGSGSALQVQEAVHGAALRPATVYVAPSGAHLKVGPAATVLLDRGLPVQGFRPSCDALLCSAAETFKGRAIGVILTGMGRDGAEGLKEIREQGGRTIAQDEASCVVFGMPKEAIALGAAEQILPLDQIAAALLSLVKEC